MRFQIFFNVSALQSQSFFGPQHQSVSAKMKPDTHIKLQEALKKIKSSALGSAPNLISVADIIKSLSTPVDRKAALENVLTHLGSLSKLEGDAFKVYQYVGKAYDVLAPLMQMRPQDVADFVLAKDQATGSGAKVKTMILMHLLEKGDTSLVPLIAGKLKSMPLTDLNRHRKLAREVIKSVAKAEHSTVMERILKTISVGTAGVKNDEDVAQTMIDLFFSDTTQEGISLSPDKPAQLTELNFKHMFEEAVLKGPLQAGHELLKNPPLDTDLFEEKYGFHIPNSPAVNQLRYLIQNMPTGVPNLEGKLTHLATNLMSLTVTTPPAKHPILHPSILQTLFVKLTSQDLSKGTLKTVALAVLNKGYEIATNGKSDTDKLSATRKFEQEFVKWAEMDDVQLKSFGILADQLALPATALVHKSEMQAFLAKLAGKKADTGFNASIYREIVSAEKSELLDQSRQFSSEIAGSRDAYFEQHRLFGRPVGNKTFWGVQVASSLLVPALGVAAAKIGAVSKKKQAEFAVLRDIAIRLPNLSGGVTEHSDMLEFVRDLEGQFESAVNNPQKRQAFEHTRASALQQLNSLIDTKSKNEVNKRVFLPLLNRLGEMRKGLSKLTHLEGAQASGTGRATVVSKELRGSFKKEIEKFRQDIERTKEYFQNSSRENGGFVFDLAKELDVAIAEFDKTGNFLLIKAFLKKLESTDVSSKLSSDKRFLRKAFKPVAETPALLDKAKISALSGSLAVLESETFTGETTSHGAATVKQSFERVNQLSGKEQVAFIFNKFNAFAALPTNPNKSADKLIQDFMDTGALSFLDGVKPDVLMGLLDELVNLRPLTKKTHQTAFVSMILFKVNESLNQLFGDADTDLDKMKAKAHLFTPELKMKVLTIIEKLSTLFIKDSLSLATVKASGIKSTVLGDVARLLEQRIDFMSKLIKPEHNVFSVKDDYFAVLDANFKLLERELEVLATTPKDPETKTEENVLLAKSFINAQAKEFSHNSLPKYTALADNVTALRDFFSAASQLDGVSTNLQLLEFNTLATRFTELVDVAMTKGRKMPVDDLAELEALYTKVNQFWDDYKAGKAGTVLVVARADVLASNTTKNSVNDKLDSFQAAFNLKAAKFGTVVAGQPVKWHLFKTQDTAAMAKIEYLVSIEERLSAFRQEIKLINDIPAGDLTTPAALAQATRLLFLSQQVNTLTKELNLFSNDGLSAHYSELELHFLDAAHMQLDTFLSPEFDNKMTKVMKSLKDFPSSQSAAAFRFLNANLTHLQTVKNSASDLGELKTKMDSRFDSYIAKCSLEHLKVLAQEIDKLTDLDDIESSLKAKVEAAFNTELTAMVGAVDKFSVAVSNGTFHEGTRGRPTELSAQKRLLETQQHIATRALEEISLHIQEAKEKGLFADATKIEAKAKGLTQKVAAAVAKRMVSLLEAAGERHDTLTFNLFKFEHLSGKAIAGDLNALITASLKGSIAKIDFDAGTMKLDRKAVTDNRDDILERITEASSDERVPDFTAAGSVDIDPHMAAGDMAKLMKGFGSTEVVEGVTVSYLPEARVHQLTKMMEGKGDFTNLLNGLLADSEIDLDTFKKALSLPEDVDLTTRGLMPELLFVASKVYDLVQLFNEVKKIVGDDKSELQQETLDDIKKRLQALPTWLRKPLKDKFQRLNVTTAIVDEAASDAGDGEDTNFCEQNKEKLDAFKAKLNAVTNNIQDGTPLHDLVFNTFSGRFLEEVLFTRDEIKITAIANVILSDDPLTRENISQYRNLLPSQQHEVDLVVDAITGEYDNVNLKLKAVKQATAKEGIVERFKQPGAITRDSIFADPVTSNGFFSSLNDYALLNSFKTFLNTLTTAALKKEFLSKLFNAPQSVSLYLRALAPTQLEAVMTELAKLVFGDRPTTFIANLDLLKAQPAGAGTVAARMLAFLELHFVAQDTGFTAASTTMPNEVAKIVQTHWNMFTRGEWQTTIPGLKHFVDQGVKSPFDVFVLTPSGEADSVDLAMTLASAEPTIDETGVRLARVQHLLGHTPEQIRANFMTNSEAVKDALILVSNPDNSSKDILNKLQDVIGYMLISEGRMAALMRFEGDPNETAILRGIVHLLNPDRRILDLGAMSVINLRALIDGSLHELSVGRLSLADSEKFSKNLKDYQKLLKGLDKLEAAEQVGRRQDIEKLNYTLMFIVEKAIEDDIQTGGHKAKDKVQKLINTLGMTGFARFYLMQPAVKQEALNNVLGKIYAGKTPEETVKKVLNAIVKPAMPDGIVIASHKDPEKGHALQLAVMLASSVLSGVDIDAVVRQTEVNAWLDKRPFFPSFQGAVNSASDAEKLFSTGHSRDHTRGLLLSKMSIHDGLGVPDLTTDVAVRNFALFRQVPNVNQQKSLVAILETGNATNQNLDTMATRDADATKVIGAALKFQRKLAAKMPPNPAPKSYGNAGKVLTEHLSKIKDMIETLRQKMGDLPALKMRTAAQEILLERYIAEIDRLETTAQALLDVVINSATQGLKNKAIIKSFGDTKTWETFKGYAAYYGHYQKIIDGVTEYTFSEATRVRKVAKRHVDARPQDIEKAVTDIKAWAKMAEGEAKKQLAIQINTEILNNLLDEHGVPTSVEILDAIGEKGWWIVMDIRRVALEDDSQPEYSAVLRLTNAQKTIADLETAMDKPASFANIKLLRALYVKVKSELKTLEEQKTLQTPPQAAFEALIDSGNGALDDFDYGNVNPDTAKIKKQYIAAYTDKFIQKHGEKPDSPSAWKSFNKLIAKYQQFKDSPPDYTELHDATLAVFYEECREIEIMAFKAAIQVIADSLGVYNVSEGAVSGLNPDMLFEYNGANYILCEQFRRVIGGKEEARKLFNEFPPPFIFPPIPSSSYPVVGGDGHPFGGHPNGIDPALLF